MNWFKVIEELDQFQKGSIALTNLSPLTLDSLHGSMWGMNHRFISVSECISKHQEALVSYSLRRIQKLVESPAVSFRVKKISRCRVGFGTYGWKYDHKLIQRAIHFGVPLIDTAEGYGYGKVEIALGEALRKSQGYVDVTTKVSRNHMSPSAIRNAAARSKKKLGIIPHYQLHFPHDKYTDEELGSTLVALRQQGTIRSIGLGNCSVDMVESMQQFLSDFSGDVIRSVQVRYNLMDRRIESALLPYCQKRGILVIAYSPLGQRYQDLHQPVLDTIAKKIGCEPSQVALSWLLSHPGVIPIPRTNNMKHLRSNIEASDVILSQSQIDELEQIYPSEKE